MSNIAKKIYKIGSVVCSLLASTSSYAYINPWNEGRMAVELAGIGAAGNPGIGIHRPLNLLLAPDRDEFFRAMVIHIPYQWDMHRNYIGGFANIAEVEEVFNESILLIPPALRLPMPVHPLGPIVVAAPVVAAPVVAAPVVAAPVVAAPVVAAPVVPVITEEDVISSVDDKTISGKSNAQQANLFLVSLSQLAPEETKETVKNIVDQSIMHTPISQEVHKSVTNNIHQRMDNVGFLNNPVAAGSEDINTSKGVWISGIYGVGKQSKTANTANYNSKVFGPTIGIDFNTNDNNMAGISYSYLLSNYKYKGINKKVDAKSNVLSFYNQSLINDSIIWDNIASFSLTKVKVKNARKISSTLSKVATGQYNNKSYSLESNLGYKISNDNGLTIIPNIGIRVSQSNDSAYTEKGAGVQNVRIKSKSDSSVVGIVGTKIVKRIQVSKDTEITPMIHASIENNFSKKQPKTNAGFVWMGNNYFQSQVKGKKDKLAYNVGAGVLARHKNVEITASYNTYLQKKYQSHQGQIKLKVSF